MFKSCLQSYIRCVIIFYCILLGDPVLSQTPPPPLPVISGFAPTPVCQGQPVVITGSNFTGATNVKLGSDDAVSFTVNSATTITAIVADQAATGKITVTTPDGTALSNTDLTILSVPKPALTDKATDPFTNCNGNATYNLNVINSSVVAGNGNQYTIDWGDNTPFFMQTDWPVNGQMTHTYAAQGYFQITMTIKSSNGCSRSVGYRFYNGQNPLASFTTSTSTTGLCAPVSVEFQIGNWFGNSPGTTYEVDFGDGTPPVVLQHPLSPTNSIRLLSHQYTKSSCPQIDFTATLRVINGCYTTTYTLNQIVVRMKPVADFDTDPTAPCLNLPVCFTNKTVNGSSGKSCSTVSNFTWDFGDGTTSNSENPPCHTYAAARTYTVTLTASNATCGSDVRTKQVVVSPPSPSPVAGPPVFYCQGETAVPLVATGVGLLWYISATGGVGSPLAPIPSTNSPGIFLYYVSQTFTNSCESIRIPVSVTVKARPPAPTVATPVQYCQHQVATPLTATGTGLLWYTNQTGGTGITTAPIPSTTTIGTTTYYVSQTVNGCEGPRAAILVAVNSLAQAPTVTTPIGYCQYQSATPLTAVGNNLLWYSNASGGIGSPTAPTPSTASAGSTIYYVSEVTGCGEGPRAAITVNVSSAPSASISYQPANLCNMTNTPAAPNPPVPVVHTGTAGGSYSITPANGLPINATTGEINPAGAVAGVYTIAYTIQSAGACPVYKATTTVTVNGTPTATIAYPAICTSDAATRVMLTGTAGGAFTSTTGLIIDPLTGIISPATSTPGTYTVTYAIAPAAPCPGFTTTTSVTITLAPSATIGYPVANVCNTLNTPATPNLPVGAVLTGTRNGVYSIAPATGLPINITTGEINPSGAAAGKYTITYTVPGAGGCANYSTTATMVVNSIPTATISYAGSPYCGSSVVSQPVSLSGTTGGRFTSSTGLSINATTGEINPAGSTPGVYTVTYTIAAAPPCPGYVATTGVTITASPVVTFPVTSQSICSGETALFKPSSTVANAIYNWSVVGPLPANVTGITTGSSSDPNAVISLSFTNRGIASQSLTVRVTPVNPGLQPCPGTSTDIVLIVHPATPAPVTTNTDLCMGTPATALIVNPLPGTTIKWYNGNGVLLNRAPVINTNLAGQWVYYVSQTNIYGCESPRAPITATVHPTAKIVSAAYNNPVACGIPSGAITLQVLDLNNAAMPNVPVVVHYNKFQIALTFSTNTNASGRMTIPLTAGTYSGIFVETAGGCLSQKIPDIFILKDPTPPLKPVAGYNPPLCSGQALTLTALSSGNNQPGTIEYVWAGPAFGSSADTVSDAVVSFPSAAMKDAGTYVVYATQNNCISPPVSFDVVIQQAPAKPVLSVRTPLCVGDDLVLQAYSSIPGNAALNYLWKGPGTGFPVNGPNAGINKVNIKDAGIYAVTVTSSQTGCSTTTDTLIQIGGYPLVAFAKDTMTLPTGYRLNLAPVITNAAAPGILPIQGYTWTPSQDLTCNDATCASPVAIIKNNICYKVDVTNIYGCKGSADICINVFCQNSQVFVPNAFVPNGNVPENRKLIVRATGISSVKSFRVFNRWGRIMFERNNFPPNSADYGWDGMVNGKPADTGVYIYTVDVICENGVPYSFKGNVTLF
ncbi:PKD domain-containing protein [Chitinophaga sp. RAB17]|uniref:Ig-like domain-containing protein n=1 Tax=Chitinophaga sp. RAB17 TaxID=3233049 RepID=UPI003F8F04B4